MFQGQYQLSDSETHISLKIRPLSKTVMTRCVNSETDVLIQKHTLCLEIDSNKNSIKECSSDTTYFLSQKNIFRSKFDSNIKKEKTCSSDSTHFLSQKHTFRS